LPQKRDRERERERERERQRGIGVEATKRNKERNEAVWVPNRANQPRDFNIFSLSPKK
jgi:hypothetical protein